MAARNPACPAKIAGSVVTNPDPCGVRLITLLRTLGAKRKEQTCVVERGARCKVVIVENIHPLVEMEAKGCPGLFSRR